MPYYKQTRSSCLSRYHWFTYEYTQYPFHTTDVKIDLTEITLHLFYTLVINAKSHNFLSTHQYIPRPKTIQEKSTKHLCVHACTDDFSPALVSRKEAYPGCGLFKKYQFPVTSIISLDSRRISFVYLISDIHFKKQEQLQSIHMIFFSYNTI